MPVQKDTHVKCESMTLQNQCLVSHDVGQVLESTAIQYGGWDEKEHAVKPGPIGGRGRGVSPHRLEALSFWPRY